MNIEDANQLLIKNTFCNFNKNLSGSDATFNVNYELVNSLLEYRRMFGPPTATELEKHHMSTAGFVKTINFKNVEG